MKLRQLVFTAQNGADITVTADHDEGRVTVTHGVMRTASIPFDASQEVFFDAVRVYVAGPIYGTSKKSATPMVMCTNSDLRDLVDLVERLRP